MYSPYICITIYLHFVLPIHHCGVIHVIIHVLLHHVAGNCDSTYFIAHKFDLIFYNYLLILDMLILPTCNLNACTPQPPANTPPTLTICNSFI